MQHKKVQIVVIDASRFPASLLLMQTNERRGAFWQNITGSVEKNEDFMTAAKRELFEETGINHSSLIDLEMEFEFQGRQGRPVLEKCFLCLLLSAPTIIKLDPHEHQNYRWIPLDEVKKEDFGHISNFEAFLKSKLKAK